MNFKTTLYNREIDLMGHPTQKDWEDCKIKCSINWRMQQDQYKDGISIAWFASEAQLEIIPTDENDNELEQIDVNIHPDNGWTIEFEESGLMRGEHFRPTGIVIQWDEMKAFCTLIREEGDGLPF